MLKLILIICQVLLICGTADGQINKLNNELNQSKYRSGKQINSTKDLNLIQNTKTTIVDIDSLLNVANSLLEQDFTVPSWTLLRRAVTSLTALRNTVSTVALQNAMINLKSKEMPYSIVCSINGAPTSRLGFAWFTNVGVTGGRVEIVQGSALDSTAFANPLFSINAKTDSVKNLNYNVAGNGLLKLAGIQDNTKKSYMQNKALAKDLSPNTFYSYRVGKPGAWSETGTFTTAKNTTEKYSFIYFTDPQAQTDASYIISQRTTHSACNLFPEASFLLGCGDLVESTGTLNSEWEYEQFFQTQQDIFLNKPLATVLGNHDISSNKNFTHHFNTDSVGFDYAISSVPGSFYSFVYGDALFLGLNFMDYNVKGKLDSVKNWMRRQVAENPAIKWRIVFYHKTIFTGSIHQSDADGKVFRDAFTPLFEELKIDLALQGHDHVYEVIGPVKYKSLVANEVSNLLKVSFDSINNVTAKSGGIFNVKDGTLYFLNNSSGPKKYAPRSEAKMDSVETGLGITNYFGLFTGRLGQGYKPTFSNITVSTDTIDVKTYEVNTAGISSLYDNFKIIKMTDVVDSINPDTTDNSISLYPVPVKEYAYVNFKDKVDASIEIYSMIGALVKSERIIGSSQINLKTLSKGVYTLKVVSGSGNFKVKFIKD